MTTVGVLLPNSSDLVGGKNSNRLEAIRNVLLLATKRNPESADLTHWPSWNLHYLREIDDADILARCTDKCSGRAAIMVYDKGPDIAHPREVGNIKVQASDTIEECSER